MKISAFSIQWSDWYQNSSVEQNCMVDLVIKALRWEPAVYFQNMLEVSSKYRYYIIT